MDLAIYLKNVKIDRCKITSSPTEVKVHYLINEHVVEQEICFSMYFEYGAYVVEKINRNEKIVIGRFPDLLFASGVLMVKYIVAYVLHHQVTETYKKLCMLVRENHIAEAEILVQENCKKQYYALHELKKGALCLVYDNNSYKVIYCRQDNTYEEISSDEKINRMLLVVFNYAQKLERFEEYWYAVIKPMGFHDAVYSFLQDYCI